MQKSYKELLAERAALEEAIQSARKSELSEKIAQVRSIVAEFGLTPQDIFPGRASKGTKSGSVAVKYRDPVSGNSWTGRGKAPKWIEGQDRTQFLVNTAS